MARRTAIDPRITALIPGFDAPFFQAGLAGYSDAAMRLIARSLGCPYCVTEALLDRTLLAGGRGFAKADLGDLAENLPGGDGDHPLAGQIMGSDPDEMARAAIKMVEQGRRAPADYRRQSAETLRAERSDSATAEHGFAAIDVNLACPVRKIKRKSRGGHWLRDPAGALEILRAVREAVPAEIPTTVKLRRGFDDSADARRSFDCIFDGAYALGYAWATVHCRTVEQKYIGPSRWTFLRQLTGRHPDRLIFGSGDIWCAGDIFEMLEYTGVHAVSVARGCIGNPWIFRQAREMTDGLDPSEPSMAEQREVLLAHFDLSVSLYGEHHASRMMRKFGIRFSLHHPRSDDVRREFIRVESPDDWRDLVARHYRPERETEPGRLRGAPVLCK